MFEYEVRAGTAPQGVRLAWHHRFVPTSSWANTNLQQRAEMFDELEAEFLAMLATAPTHEIQIGTNSWRVIPHTGDQLRLEVSGPVYRPSREPTPSFETRPIPTAESAGAATRALIMAANELTVAVRVMIGDSELHVLHRPVEQLERCLAAWPDEVARTEAVAAPTREAARVEHLAKVSQLLDKAISDATRLGSDYKAGDVAVRLLEHQAALMGLYWPGES